MGGFNTNLAAEFYVLSILHRLGLDANLTLGNKKAVDIAIIRAEAEAFTIDVKGLAGSTAWPVDNLGERKAGHFLAMVCFNGKIEDVAELPEVYVVPSDKLRQKFEPGAESDWLIWTSKTSDRRVIQLARMRTVGKKFHDAWGLVTGDPRHGLPT